MSLKPKCLIFICFIIIFSTFFDGAPAQSLSVCFSQTSCDKCLEADPSCAWCTDRAYDMNTPRCMTKNELIQLNCRSEFIQQNKKLRQNVLRNNPLGDFSLDSFEANQIQPQKVKLNLKKGESQMIKMRFRAAKNYPLDLYYLMDLTWTMKDDKETLVRMGGSLAKALNNLTTNNRLGFGSFADKPTMPYIMTRETERANPCIIEGSQCEPTYLYRHRLSLTQDTASFIQQVNASEVTGNVDNMEGGLEALMQVLVCDDQIGWQDKSRKIIVFASDGPMHVAGMGLLGGVVKRNDKLCHLNAKGEYTAALLQDYPSLEEVYRELVNRKVNVIFAVTEDTLSHFRGIHSVMSDLTSVGALQSDSSNVLQLVENGFREFSRKVNFQDNAPPFIRVEYFTTCGGKYSTPVQSNVCDNVEIGEVYEFDVRLTLLENPDSPQIGRQVKQTVKIEEASLTDTNLELDIDLEWTCTCLRDEIGDANSALCNEQGEMKCGMCFCNEGFIGKQCDCNLRNFTSNYELEKQCQDPKDITGALCSNRGECLCGTCYCDKGWEGEHCHCQTCTNNCGGPTKGKCDCGKCECLEGWSGDNCECTTSLDSCIAPDTSQVCSGKGECSCGECQCGEGFFGDFCESERGEGSTLCLHYEPCVEAKIRQTMGQVVNNYLEICSSNQTGHEHSHVFVDELPESDVRCIARIRGPDYICEFKFIYTIDPFKLVTLQIQEETCPPANYAMFGFIAALIVTLLAGIIGLVAWKICTSAHDRREYARFEQQLSNTRNLQMSPLYRSPISQFKNPQFTFEQTGYQEASPEYNQKGKPKGKSKADKRSSASSSPSSDEQSSQTPTRFI